MEYKKFYNLDGYLFSEVTENWHQRGYLNPEEFFCITIWKANRSKTWMKNKLLKMGNLREVIKKITSDIHSSESDREALKILLEKYRFRLPMASAILAVYKPEKFVVYDYRGREILGLKDFAYSKRVIERYFNEYLFLTNKQAVGKTAREKDMWLWGKSFYNDLIDFIKK